LHEEGKVAIGSEGIHLRPNFHYTFSVITSQTQSDSSVKGVDFAKRECILQEEVPGHQPYFHEECIMRCKVRMAEEKCGCVPWRFTFNLPEDSTVRVCRANSVCFSMAFAEAARKCGSDVPETFEGGVPDLLHAGYCPRLCDVTSYSFSYTREEIDVGKREVTCDELSFAMFIPYLKDAFTLGPHKDNDCRDTLNSSTLITIKLANEYTTVIRQAKRVSFTSQLADLGGIAGLFTGMSLLSGIEVIYWSAKATMELISKMVKRKKTQRMREI